MDARGRRALVCVLVVIGCLIAVGPGAVAGADADTGQTGEPNADAPREPNPDVVREPNAAIAQDNGSAAADLSDADEIHVRFDVRENRSAAVTVNYRYRLNRTEESDLDWDGLKTDIESNPEPYLEAENRSWQATAERAQNETGREMNLSNFEVWTNESEQPVNLGHVRFRFEWSSFAYSEPKYMRAGDALVGFALVDGTQLTIAWPDTYNATRITPEPTMREEFSAHWSGSEVEFDDGQPRVELVPNGATGGSDEDQLGWGISWQTGVAIGVLATVLVAAVGLAGWRLTRDRTAEPIANSRDARRNDGHPEIGSSDPPSELLSNEEQVLDLLERRGGRLKQQQVVSELNWTEAKTSQVVTGLREADEIEVFRIGRENVLVLADEGE